MQTKAKRCKVAPGFSISRVVTGLWQIADLERDGKTLDRQKTASEMQPYYDAGFTTFDMADHYGSAEEIAGCFQNRCSSGSVQLLTKWVPRPGAVSRKAVRQAVQRSLDRLQTNCLDMLQFHAWNYADPSYLDTLWWLQELRKEGLIRHLGLTNFDAAHLCVIVNSGIEVVSNQICFSLLDQRARHAMSDVCQLHDVKILAFGVLAGGFLTERWLGKPEPDWDRLDTWSQMKYGRFIREAGGWQPLQDLLGVLNDVALRHSVSIANVACRAILDQPAVGGIIVGARLGESAHIEDNLRLSQFLLSAESHNQIEEALSHLQAIPGDCGDEYRRPPFLTASGDLSHHLDAMPLPYEAQEGHDARTKVLTGTVWEDLAGFSRAVRHGDRIWVSGTTATHGSHPIGGSDPAAQTHFIIDKIEGAIQSLGGKLQDVVRTRIFVRNLADWEAVARVHGKRFREIQPANTLVQADLVGDQYLVEIEVEAVVS